MATNNWWSIGRDGPRVVVCDSQVRSGGGPMVANVWWQQWLMIDGQVDGGVVLMQEEWCRKVERDKNSGDWGEVKGCNSASQY